jgi:Zn-dependent protease
MGKSWRFAPGRLYLGSMLRWSINLCRIFGIQLAVHVSFLLLLAWFAFAGWQEGGAVGAGWSLLLVTAFFGCVVLHELGHSLTAMRYGVRVPRILLMPIGGMAEFDRLPRRPLTEFLITAAGPAVNFALVALLLPFVWSDLWSSEPVPAHSLPDLLLSLAGANAVMGLFNLLPVFPMDGGRILRALLASRLPYLRATYWASLVGRILALVFAAVAAFEYGNYLLSFLFVFIYFAGDAEYRQVLAREQEAAYWAERARLAATAPGPDDGPPPPPPLIYPGRS